LHSNFDAHRVRHLHLVNFWFQAEGKSIESQLQHLFEFTNAFSTISDKAEIEILGCPGGASETQLHRYASFQEVRIDNTAFDDLFEHAAER
jgi:hypothetical protein